MNTGRTLAALLTLVLICAASALAQPFPNRPIRLIVADPPGGAPDQLSRIVAQAMGQSIGQQVVIDNRPGAAGILGAQVAARSPADGYTLLLATTATYAILPNLKKDLPYDFAKDFVPIGRIATASNVLVINKAVSANNVAELVALAKAKPGAMNYASAGIGTPAHLAGEMLNLLAGIKLTHIPYKGAAPALLDVIAGNAALIITSPTAAAAHMNEGRVRALATTGAQRNPSLPALPTIAETVPGYEISQSWGLVAPAGTPAAVLAQLTRELAKALADADVQGRIAATGAVPAGAAGLPFGESMAQERERLKDVITRSGITLAE